jgi:hypothetical protein
MGFNGKVYAMWSFLFQRITPLFYALKRQTLQALIVASLLIGLSASGALANTIEHISLEKQADGKLNINVNVTGNARELAPDEHDNEGVYTLGLQGNTSEKVRATPLVMDPSGQHIARLNVEHGKVSVVVPGVSAEDIRVNMRNHSGGSTTTGAPSSAGNGLHFQPELSPDTSIPSQGYALSNTWTPTRSLPLSALGETSSMVPAFEFSEPPTTTQSPAGQGYHPRYKASKWKRTAHHAYRSFHPATHRVKSAPPVSWVSAWTPKSAQKTPPAEAVLEQVSTLEGGVPLNEPQEESALLPSERLENKNLSVEEMPERVVLQPLNEQGYEPNPALEYVISEAQAYDRYLRLPWEDEAWLNERIKHHLQAEEARFQAHLWMMYLCIGGMVLAVALGLAFKLNPTWAYALARFKSGLFKTDPAKAWEESTLTPLEKMDLLHEPEKPFASWLMPQATEVDETPATFSTPVQAPAPTRPHQTHWEQDTLLDDESALIPLDAVTRPRLHIPQLSKMSEGSVPSTPKINDLPLVLQLPAPPLAQALEQTPVPAVEEAPALEEAPVLSKVATLKAPPYFSFRHHQKSRQDVPTKAPIKALFALPNTPVKPAQGVNTRAYSRLNRLHFG